MMLRDERGFTLIELLIVMAISIVVLSASLGAFNSFYQAGRDNDTRIATAEIARNGLDVQARQLRNLAKRLNNTDVIARVTGDDLIFQTSEPSRTWVRYCLSTSAPASPDRGQLWVQELSLPSVAASAAPTGTACPATAGYTATRVVADFVTNRRASLNRPIFSYSCTSGTMCTSSPTTYDQVVNITAQAFVDTTPGRGPAELRVVSGVYLRNQNQLPVARFVHTPKASASRTVVLNASGSSDYEGRTLNYYWFEQTMPAPGAIDCAQPNITFNADGSVRTLWGVSGPVTPTGSGPGFIGESITLEHRFQAGSGAAGTSRNIGLVVCDPGDRYSTAGFTPAVPVQIPN